VNLRLRDLFFAALTIIPALPLAARAQSAPFRTDVDLLKSAREGMRRLMNGDIDGALHRFQELQEEDPSSPLGYLFEADAYWWKIYLTTGNLIDPDVFDVVSKSTSPYDPIFESQVQQAISRADARVRARQDKARSLLEEGMAYGLLARFYGLRDNDLPTARAGKKMRSLLLQALKLDPNLTDAYLGIGIYNYFVDTLPTIIKLLKFLILLPGGDRELGLQQLETAARKGDLTRGEAMFYLAKDFSRTNERQYSKSLALFQELAAEYPDHQLWKLVEGSLLIRLGRTQEGVALYREVEANTSALSTEAGKSIHAQVEKALARMHSGHS
jgi:tetratricopeptide (TPR) repeat protein